MRICVVYDCLFPHTVGGAERWYRNVAERLAADGHTVTYLTMRQWDGPVPSVPGVDVIVVSPRMALYTAGGRRRISQAMAFGAGVLIHLARRGRHYDVVHMASFPYFSLLAAAVTRRHAGFRLVVDWHEVWSRAYWREYLGRLGFCGWAVQGLCARVRQRAICFSQLHAARLREIGLAGDVTIVRGEYDGPIEVEPSMRADPVVVYAGRHIPEKRVPTVVPAVAAAAADIPGLRAVIFGDGPDRAAVLRAVEDRGLAERFEVPGFVAAPDVDRELRRALCLILPSRREGYGLIVVEAASHGTPSIVVADPDNAATELIDDGENGFIAPSADASDLAAAIVQIWTGGAELRASTAAWFTRHCDELSLSTSLDAVTRSYSGISSAAA